MTPVEATTLAQYVLAIGAPDAAPAQVAMQGALAIPAAATPPGGTSLTRPTQSGSYLIRATYTDRGAPGATPITSSDVLLLRQPRLVPEEADVISEGTTYAPSRGDPSFVINKSGAHVGYRGIDLTGVDTILVGVLTRFYAWSHFIGGTVELRLDSPTGQLLGGPVRVVPPIAPTAQTGANQAGGGPNAVAPAQGQGAGAPPPPGQPAAAPAGGQGQAPAQPGAPAAPGQGQAPPAAPGGGQGGQGAGNPATQNFMGANLERPLRFPIAGTTGPRDLYIVFRNESEANSLFLLVSVDFKQNMTPTTGAP